MRQHYSGIGQEHGDRADQHDWLSTVEVGQPWDKSQCKDPAYKDRSANQSNLTVGGAGQVHLSDPVVEGIIKLHIRPITDECRVPAEIVRHTLDLLFDVFISAVKLFWHLFEEAQIVDDNVEAIHT